MNSIILVSPEVEKRLEYIKSFLKDYKLDLAHQDVMFLDQEEKLGVEQVKKIRQFLSIKPYSAKNKVVALLSADKLSTDAQNAMLKTLEEPPIYAFLLLGVVREEDLLETIRSRGEVINLQFSIYNLQKGEFGEDILRLMGATIEERFEFVERLQKKEEFLEGLLYFFRQKMVDNPKMGSKITKDILKAIEWKEQKGNIRAILEYLMLRIPETGK